jgi:PST family polysaccharide transporter
VIDLASRSLQQAALPELARRQHQPDALRRRAVRVLHISALASVPTLGILAAAAEPLLRVLGPAWVGAAPSVEILCWWASAAAIMLMTGAVLQASGRPYLLAGLQWFAAGASLVVFVSVGSSLRDDTVAVQVAGIATARAVLYSTVLLAMNAIVLRWALAVSIRAQAGAVSPAAVAAIVAYLAGTAARAAVGPAPAMTALVISVVVAGLAAVGVLALIDPVARSLVGRARTPSPAPEVPVHTIGEHPGVLVPAVANDGSTTK